jgi:hypothetical protein
VVSMLVGDLYWFGSGDIVDDGLFRTNMAPIAPESKHFQIDITRQPFCAKSVAALYGTSANAT